MKFTVELNDYEFKEDMLEAVDYRVINDKGSLRLRIYMKGFISAQNQTMLEVVKTATQNHSDGMMCKVCCIDDENRVVRQYEINKVYFYNYKELYDYSDGRGRFELTLSRTRYNRVDYMTDIMVFTENEL